MDGHPGHRTTAELDAALGEFRLSPSDGGPVELVVSRPVAEVRDLLDEGRLDPVEGLVGDNWRARGSRSMPDGAANPDCQLTLINTRLARFVAGADAAQRALAGDQLHVDLDLSLTNLPPGTQLVVGTAVIEVTPEPHTGCAKFVARYGKDAMRFVNSPAGRELRLRGMNTRVVVGGTVRPGDSVRKIPAAQPAERQLSSR